MCYYQLAIYEYYKIQNYLLALSCDKSFINLVCLVPTIIYASQFFPPYMSLAQPTLAEDSGKIFGLWHFFYGMDFALG